MSSRSADPATWFAAVFLTAALGVVQASQAAEPDRSSGPRILDSQLRLAESLIGAIAKDKPGENITVSPASVAGMLAAVDLGAGGILHAAIRKTLQIEPGTTASQDVDALRAATARGLEDGPLTSATRLMFDRSVPPTGEALKRLSDAGVETTTEDLHSGGAIADIDAWAAHATHGRIDHVMDRVDPLDVMIALNALYFKDNWAASFKKSETSPGDFHTADGRRIRATMMHSRLGSFRSREDDRFTAVALPFRQGRFSMVVLTTKDKPLDVQQFESHLPWLTGRDFAPRDHVILDLPRFKTESREDLMSILTSLGLDPAGPFPNFSQKKLKITQIKQIVDIGFDEEGAEIAAVTVGGFEIQSSMRYANVAEIVVDKPFAFALRDDRTGLIIAAGFISALEGAAVAANDPPLSARSPNVGSEAETRARNAERQWTTPEDPTVPNDHGRLNLKRDF